MADKIRVTIWNEFRHEKTNEEAKALYPNGLHACIKESLDKYGEFEVRLAALDDPEQGLPDDVLEQTDVLLWWGHMSHGEVKDELADKIKNRVFLDGMGFIPLHSAHMSKPFQRILGTSGYLLWGDNQDEIIWNLNAAHPIAAGIPERIDLGVEEMYGEPFMIPQPDELVFGSWFEHGYIFRSGCCFYRGRGKVFYFQPGHETCASFHNAYVQKILYNAVKWAAPNDFGSPMHNCDYRPSLRPKKSEV